MPPVTDSRTHRKNPFSLQVYYSRKQSGLRVLSDKPYTEVITAVLVIEVVDERALLSVVEKDPYHAEPPGEGRVFLLDDLALAPRIVSTVFDLVAQPQI